MVSCCLHSITNYLLLEIFAQLMAYDSLVCVSVCIRFHSGETRNGA